jgi:pilus assembly protein Flp/PilA
MSLIAKFLEEEEGATAVEYSVMLAMILLVAFATITAFGAKTSGVWDTIRSGVIGM